MVHQTINSSTSSANKASSKINPMYKLLTGLIVGSLVACSTPVWLFSQGPQTQLARLVLAQDTGSAIQGAVRADYFAGSGAAAGELAGRLKQDLQLWVLLPR